MARPPTHIPLAVLLVALIGSSCALDDEKWSSPPTFLIERVKAEFDKWIADKARAGTIPIYPSNSTTTPPQTKSPGPTKEDDEKWSSPPKFLMERVKAEFDKWIADKARDGTIPTYQSNSTTTPSQTKPPGPTNEDDEKWSSPPKFLMERVKAEFDKWIADRVRAGTLPPYPSDPTTTQSQTKSSEPANKVDDSSPPPFLKERVKAELNKTIADQSRAGPLPPDPSEPTTKQKPKPEPANKDTEWKPPREFLKETVRNLLFDWLANEYIQANRSATPTSTPSQTPASTSSPTAAASPFTLPPPCPVTPSSTTPPSCPSLPTPGSTSPSPPPCATPPPCCSSTSTCPPPTTSPSSTESYIELTCKPCSPPYDLTSSSKTQSAWCPPLYACSSLPSEDDSCDSKDSISFYRPTKKSKKTFFRRPYGRPCCYSPYCCSSCCSCCSPYYCVPYCCSPCYCSPCCCSPYFSPCCYPCRCCYC